MPKATFRQNEGGWVNAEPIGGPATPASKNTSVFLGSPFTTDLGGGKEEGGTPEAVERVEERQEAD